MYQSHSYHFPGNTTQIHQQFFSPLLTHTNELLYGLNPYEFNDISPKHRTLRLQRSEEGTEKHRLRGVSSNCEERNDMCGCNVDC